MPATIYAISMASDAVSMAPNVISVALDGISTGGVNGLDGMDRWPR